MNFGLTEEQEMLQETVRSFVEGESPVTRVRELFDADSARDPGVWKGLAELGLTGIVLPEEHGGASSSATRPASRSSASRAPIARGDSAA